jgi:hypothetical protein
MPDPIRETTLTAEDAIKRAFMEEHRCTGIGGAALSASFSLGVHVTGDGRHPWVQGEMLRQWSRILRAAADKLDGGRPHG